MHGYICVYINVYKCIRTDGSHFNLRRPQTHSKIQDILIRDLVFADAAESVAHTKQALQRITSGLADASQMIGPDVNLKNTEVLYQPIPREEHRPTHVTIGDVEQKSEFAYMGSIVSSDARIDNEINSILSRQIDYLVDFTNVFGATKAWRTRQRFRSTEPWFLPLSSAAQKLLSPTAIICVSSSAVISAVTAAFSTFAGVTSSQILKFWNKSKSQALKLCY